MSVAGAHIAFVLRRIDGPSLESDDSVTLLRLDGAGRLAAPVDAARVVAWIRACGRSGFGEQPPAAAAPTALDLVVETAERLLAYLHGRAPSPVRPARAAAGGYLLSAAAEAVGRRATQIAIAFVAGIAGHAAPLAPERLEREIGQLRGRIPDLAGNADPVTPLIVAAARELAIPCRRSRIHPGTLVLGEGKRQIRFDRSAPLSAPTLGAVVSPDKLTTKRFLAGLGIPVLPVRVPVDAAEAVRVASDLGFPVAVKPVDGTLSEGVTLDVRTPDDVAAAFAVAAAAGTAVMIEPYLDIPDFRATVIAGRVAIVMRRNRPYVVGDGQRTIAALIAAHNDDLRHGRARFPAAYPIAIDAEVRRTLAGAGLDPETVPEAGRQVHVRTSPVRALGGFPTDETRGTHPDLIRLFERIAQVLAMPIVAIDFRAEAIARSWRDQRMAVLEVNARPGIGDLDGDRLARTLLRAHFPEPAAVRLPTVLVVDPDAGRGFAAARAALQDVAGLGLSGPGGIVLDGFPAGTGTLALAAAHDRIAEDPAVGVALHWTTPEGIAERGLGLARIDLAFLAPAGDGGRAAVAALVRRRADRVEPLPEGPPEARVAAVAAALGRFLAG